MESFRMRSIGQFPESPIYDFRWSIGGGAVEGAAPGQLGSAGIGIETLGARRELYLR